APSSDPALLADVAWGPARKKELAPEPPPSPPPPGHAGFDLAGLARCGSPAAARAAAPKQAEARAAPEKEVASPDQTEEVAWERRCVRGLRRCARGLRRRPREKSSTGHPEPASAIEERREEARMEGGAVVEGPPRRL
ncbi:unnamed protein product, partial [Urochloa humidicola]